MNSIQRKVAQIVQRVLSRLKSLTPERKVLIALSLAAVLTAYYARRNSNNNVGQQQSEQQQQITQKAKSTKNVGIVASNNPEEQCRANALPSFVNVSLGWRNSSTPLEAFKKLSPPSVMVLSAGNHHPVPLRASKAQASRDIDAIVVGSIAPNGQRSGFSQQGREVHVSAPADYHMSSVDENGNYAKFGGTSGAAPLVTGSLAGFEWLSGYHPTAEEAKLLLEKTAIPTLSANKDPRMNGVGMLNAYKLGMVGKRLKDTCGTNISCFKDMVQKEATYQFPEDQGLSTAVDQAFPECSQNMCRQNNSSCQDKASVFKRLRKAAFLNPSNKDLWRSIACVYYSSGFTQNAEGAMSTYKAIVGKTDTSLYTSCQKDSDCAYVPSCSAANALIPVNKDYVAECSGAVLCNNKCRCGNQESNSVDQNTFNLLQARCVSSQCVSSSQVRARQSQPRQPAAVIPSDRRGTGSIQ